jgi:glycosyltransferase involved in cell wall biosynthesis
MINDLNNKKIKRIGIDARFYGPLGKGLGRYTKEVVDKVIELDKDNEYVIFLSRENFTDFKTENRNVKKVLAAVRWYTLAEQILMPYYIYKENLDIMHFPHFNVPILCPVKFIVTIHDLILTKFPTQRASTLSPILYKIKNLAYKIIIQNAVKKSCKIIAVSEFTKKDILNNFKIKADKIAVTYEGVAAGIKSNEQYPEQILEKHKIEKPYLLYVGNAYPHKNLEWLIKAFASLGVNENLSLILVGKDDYFYERVKTFTKNLNRSKIIFPGFVLDEELSIFYKEAIAFVFPSLYEGFGLPPLEAMTHGCPVISSNKASMPEILGDAALYFDPEDDCDIKNKIISIIKDNNLREKLIENGYEQVKKYSWLECARKTLEIYRKI